MHEIDSRKFGERLREAIKSAGTTQKDLATKIGVSKTAINNYVGGRIPDASILYKISKILNTTMEWLLAGEDTKNINKTFDKEEFELINLYSSCDEEQKKDIFESIKSYLSDPDYNFKRPLDSLSEEEIKILELFRNLTARDKIKIEGIIESKLMDSKNIKRGLSSSYQSGEEAATREKKHA